MSGTPGDLFLRLEEKAMQRTMLVILGLLATDINRRRKLR